MSKEIINVEATPASEVDVMLKTWALDSYKTQFPFMIDVLKQLVTLNVSLLGGSFFFLNESNMPKPFRVGLAVLFLLSLMSAFAGLIPYHGQVNVFVPASIRAHKEKLANYRMLWITAASLFLIGGFIVALIGLAKSI